MSDETLWERIKQTITPIDRDDVLSHVEKRTTKRRALSRKPPTLSHEETPRPSLSHQPTSVDRKTMRHLEKGKITVDGKLDLHGLTVVQAHRRFKQYILEAVAEGKKHIIVVTGKGRQEKGTGVIRRELPHWIEDPDISRSIHSFSEPHRNQGRYVIVLRRKR